MIEKVQIKVLRFLRILIKINFICIGIWKMYWTKQFPEIKYNEISQNFTILLLSSFLSYFVFREIKKIQFRDHPL
jgi:hypothetical protein